MPHDIVIRNGTLVDGTGAPGRPGDLALDGDRITAVGEVPERGRREINAEGKFVTPGFVDIHTHLDAQIAWDPIASSSCYHGITSAVIGNCGVTFAPLQAGRPRLSRPHDGIRRRHPPATPSTPACRGTGKPTANTSPASTAWTRASTSAAWWGTAPCASTPWANAACPKTQPKPPTTTSPACATWWTRPSAPAPSASPPPAPFCTRCRRRHVPGTYADPKELLAMGRVLGRHGKGIFEGALRIGERDREEGLPKTRAEIAWVGELSRQNNVRCTFGLAHSYRRPELYRRVIEFAEEENAKGAQLRPQTSSRGIGGLFGLDHRTPFDATPAWRELRSMSFAERVRALEDESFRARLTDLTEQPTLDLAQAYILTDDDLDYVHDRNRSLAALAERTGQTPVEAFIELNRRHKGRVQLWHPGLNQSMDAIEEMITNPTVAMGLADSGAHVGQIMDASSPTWLLTHWVKTRGVMSLEQAVQSWTSDTAAIFGIRERGVLKEAHSPT